MNSGRQIGNRSWLRFENRARWLAIEEEIGLPRLAADQQRPCILFRFSGRVKAQHEPRIEASTLRWRLASAPLLGVIANAAPDEFDELIRHHKAILITISFAFQPLHQVVSE